MKRDDIRVRPLSRDDVPEAVAIHLAAFEGFYLATLGSAFLAHYYDRVLSYPAGVCIGAFLDDSLAGFAAGFIDPARFYQHLRAARLQLAIAALPALLRRPARIVRFLTNYRRTSAAAAAPHDPMCTSELSSIAVRPGREGRGVGTTLLHAFTAEATARGARRIVLTTDAMKNERVNRFYIRHGFELAGSFTAPPGRTLNEYVMWVGGDAPHKWAR
jgi:ribosomal protein S18 acetylase RimI-like enzyme